MSRLASTLALGALLFAVGCDRGAETSSEPPPAGTQPEQPAAPSASPESARDAPAATDDEPQTAPRKPATGRFHDVHMHLNAMGAVVTLEFLDPWGLDRLVNLSGGNPGSARWKESQALLEYTKGRVVPFFNIDWTRLETEGDDFGTAIAADLRTAVQAGYGGLKISKALGLNVERADGSLLEVDDPLLDPIFETAGELGVPVAIHTGDPKAFFEPISPTNERFEELAAHPSWSFHGDAYPSREALLAARDRRLARHPGTTFILVHFANNPEDIGYVREVLEAHPNANVDIAARLGEIGRHDAAAVRQIFVDFADRILFGTDFMCFARQREGEDGVRLSMILGSSGPDDEPPPTVDDATTFFEAHWRFLEDDDAAMPNPVPIQGRWDIHPLDLPDDVLDKLYLGNAERLIFDPWDARHAGRFTAGDPPTE